LTFRKKDDEGKEEKKVKDGSEGIGSDIEFLNSPPAHLRKVTNIDAPINVDEEDDENLQPLRRFTPAENERRRALGLDSDVTPEELAREAKRRREVEVKESGPAANRLRLRDPRGRVPARIRESEQKGLEPI
jgi:hypothetical protein